VEEGRAVKAFIILLLATAGWGWFKVRQVNRARS
jgi:hypothetical protein